MNIVTGGLGGNCLITRGYGCPPLAERPTPLCQITLKSLIEDDLLLFSILTNSTYIMSFVACEHNVESPVSTDVEIDSAVATEVTLVSTICDAGEGCPCPSG